LSAAAVVFGSAALAVGGWFAWRWYAAPTPPAVNLDGAEPDVAAAVEAARQKVRQDPYSAAAWGALGRLLRSSGYSPDAAVCFDQAERLDPSDPRWPYLCGEALELRDPDAALPHLRRAVAVCDRAHEDNLAPRLRLAEALLARGPDGEAEAEAVLRRALEIDDDDPSVHLDLGQLAYQRDELEEARAQFARCEKSPQTHKLACVRLAEVCGRLGKDKAAAEFARTAAAAPPDRHWPDPWLTECFQQGVGVADLFRRADQLEAQDHLPEAVELLRDAAERSPDYRVSVELGKDLALLEDYAAAEAALKGAVRQAPEKFQAHFQLSKALVAWAEKRRQAGDADGARRLYEESEGEARAALARKADDGPAYVLLGLALKGQGRRAAAEAAFRDAAARAPGDADAYLYLGELLAEDGRTGEARAALEAAARLTGPKAARAREALARLQKPR
jgi:tetratricopeptide (TPR) repeat protein